MIIVLRSIILITILYNIEQCSSVEISAKNESTSAKLATELIDANTMSNDKNDQEPNTDDFFTNPDQHTVEEGRSVRCLLGSARHLRKGDADRVAKYFLNGGPLAGHSHFVGASNTRCNTDNDDQVETTRHENYVGVPMNKNLKSNLYNPVLGSPHAPTFYIPNNSPILGSPLIYTPKAVTNRLHLPVNPMANIYHPGSPIGLLPSLYSRPEAYLYNHGHNGLPRSLLRAASFPTRGLIHPQSLLHNMIMPHAQYHVAFNDNILGSTNVGSQSRCDNNPSKNSWSDRQNSPLVGASNAANTNENEPRCKSNESKSRLETSPPATNQGTQSNQGVYGFYPAGPINLLYPQPSGHIVRLVPHNLAVPSSSETVGSPRQHLSECEDNAMSASERSNADVTQELEPDTQNSNDEESKDADVNEQLEEANENNVKEISKRECKIHEEPSAPAKKVIKKSVKQSKSKTVMKPIS